MTPRENLLRALRRQGPERVPFDLTLCPALREEFSRRTGHRDYVSYYDLPVRSVSPAPIEPPSPRAGLLRGMPPGSKVDEWGIGWFPAGFHHFEGMRHPLADADSEEQIRSHPLPDLACEDRFVSFDADVRRLQESGYAVLGSCAPVGGTVLWPAYKLRGMDNLLQDLLLREAIATALLDKVTAACVGLAERLARAGVDILWLADDYGTQRALLVSPGLWREWFKPRLARVIVAARTAQPGILIALHSDGNVQELIPDLIEIGIDILNPVQPECMEPRLIKRRYGDRLSLWGAIGTQSTMPFASPNEIERTVRDLVDALGTGGGYLAAPTHVLEPEVPWENVEAFLRAVRE